MLTKSLARYRIYKGKVKPGFIDPEDSDLLQTASTMIEIFENGMGATRESLTEDISLFIEGAEHESALLRGLEKLLLDRSEFEVPEDETLIQWRTRVFDITAELHQNPKQLNTPEDYEAELEAKLGEPIDALRARLFSDLPAFHPLTKFKSLKAHELLHRYNTSLIQWLLINTDTLTVALEKPKTAALRQLLKYLRFQQLLATISKTGKGRVVLQIDGPLNLFQQSKKYGLNLARFFPAVLYQERWCLKANLSLGNKREAQLEIDHNLGIQPPESRFLAYVPREIDILGKGLASKAPAWKVKQGGSFPPLEGEIYSFPDFKLTHESGLATHVELFHNWHDTQLTTRLTQLASCSEGLLLLGVAHKLSKKPEIASALQDSPYFQRWGFFFNDIPSVKQVLPLLQKLQG